MFIAVRLSMWRLLTNTTDMDMDGMITVFTGEYSKNFGSVLIHTRFIILTSTVWTTVLFFQFTEIERVVGDRFDKELLSIFDRKKFLLLGELQSFVTILT